MLCPNSKKKDDQTEKIQLFFLIHKREEDTGQTAAIKIEGSGEHCLRLTEQILTSGKLPGNQCQWRKTWTATDNVLEGHLVIDGSSKYYEIDLQEFNRILSIHIRDKTFMLPAGERKQELFEIFQNKAYAPEKLII